MRTIHRAAPPGGRLLVFELLRGDAPSVPVDLMDLNMLVMLGGRERSKDEFCSLFEATGWKLDRVVPTHGPFVILEASRG